MTACAWADTKFAFLPLALPRGTAEELAEDAKYMAHLAELDRIREWIRHLPEGYAFELAQEVMDKSAPDPFIMLLSLPPDSLVWLAEHYGPVKP